MMVMQGKRGLWGGCCHFPGTQQQGPTQANSWNMLPPAGTVALALALPLASALLALALALSLALALAT